MIALSGAPVLRTARLVLRAPEGGDWPAWRAFYLSDRARFIRPSAEVEGAPRTAWRAFGHAIGHWAMRGYGSFVFHLADDPAPLGMAGPWFPEGWPEREIGWTVWRAEAEGRGLAFEAAAAARAYAFGALGWETAVSYVDPANARSAALARRLGAAHDPDAAGLQKGDLVFRHPRPEAG
jgi:RimJ/RimL family protein N-acetyltransferase